MATMIRFEGRIHEALNPVARVYVDNTELAAFKGWADTAKKTILALAVDETGAPIEHDDGIYPDAWHWEQVTGDIKIFLSAEVLTDDYCIRNKLFERT